LRCGNLLVVAPKWPPPEEARDRAERRDAVFLLRLWTWLVRRNGRAALPPRRRGVRYSYIVQCRRCWRIVMMPTRLAPVEQQRMRLHLNLHGRFFTPTAEELLQHFELKPRRAR
jgi:hypothetical protein